MKRMAFMTQANCFIYFHVQVMYFILELYTQQSLVSLGSSEPTFNERYLLLCANYDTFSKQELLLISL
jgi:hypothetical protein